MATGVETQDKELPVSPETSSDQIIDHACQPCLDVEIKEASGYCVDCEEWLCSDCFRYHTRPKPSRHHVILSKEELQQKGTAVQTKDICTIKCGKHEDRYIEYYCSSHDYFGCSKCFIKYHKSCEEQSIDELSSGVDYQLFSGRLTSIEKALCTVEDQSRQNIQLAEKSNGQVMEAFCKFRKDIITALDIAENKILSGSSKYKGDETTRMVDVSKQCKMIITEVREIQAKVEQFENKGQYKNAFVYLKNKQTNVESLEIKVKELEHSEPVRELIFIRNQTLKDFVKNPKQIGTLRNDIDDQSINLNHVVDININSTGEADWWITGSVLLSVNRLVVVDRENKKLKLIDTNQQKVTAEIDTKHDPWSVARLANEEVIVSCDSDLLLVKVQDNFFIRDEIGVKGIGGTCRGVTVSDDKIFTTFKDPSKLCILNKKGCILQTIEKDDKGQPLFSKPVHLALSPNEQMLYLSNISNDSIVCAGLDGRIKFQYAGTDLKAPEQIAVDRFGRVYVCGFNSRTIHLFTPDLKKIKVFSSDKLKATLSLSLCNQKHELYVGMYQNNCIYVFQIYN